VGLGPIFFPGGETQVPISIGPRTLMGLGTQAGGKMQPRNPPHPPLVRGLPQRLRDLSCARKLEPSAFPAPRSITLSFLKIFAGGGRAAFFLEMSEATKSVVGFLGLSQPVRNRSPGPPTVLA